MCESGRGAVACPAYASLTAYRHWPRPRTGDNRLYCLYCLTAQTATVAARNREIPPRIKLCFRAVSIEVTIRLSDMKSRVVILIRFLRLYLGCSYRGGSGSFLGGRLIF